MLNVGDDLGRRWYRTARTVMPSDALRLPADQTIVLLCDGPAFAALVARDLDRLGRGPAGRRLRMALLFCLFSFGVTWVLGRLAVSGDLVMGRARA